VKEALAHLAGDYCVQSDWVANAKTERWGAALAHGATYAACFLPLTRSPLRLTIIGGTHAVIDHYRLAKHLTWAKNQLAPQDWRYDWSEAGPTGFQDSKPDWLGFWLMIVVDNTMHLLINHAALNWRNHDEAA